MAKHPAEEQRNEQAFGTYVRQAAGTGTTSTAGEPDNLADLRDRNTTSA